MASIFKYTISRPDYQIPLPVETVILSAQLQHGHIVVWATVPEIKPTFDKGDRGPLRTLRVLAVDTGDQAPPTAYTFLATIQIREGAIVKHIFYRWE